MKAIRIFLDSLFSLKTSIFILLHAFSIPYIQPNLWTTHQ